MSVSCRQRLVHRIIYALQQGLRNYLCCGSSQAKPQPCLAVASAALSRPTSCFCLLTFSCTCDNPVCALQMLMKSMPRTGQQMRRVMVAPALQPRPPPQGAGSP